MSENHPVDPVTGLPISKETGLPISSATENVTYGPKLMGMLAQRKFNEVENRKREEEEAWKKWQYEQDMKMREIQKREQEQKEREEELKAKAASLKRHTQRFLNGEYHRCINYHRELEYARCSNRYCARLFTFGPVIKHIHELLNESHTTSTADNTSTTTTTNSNKSKKTTKKPKAKAALIGGQKDK